jgi:hypothetical protein
MAQAVTDLSLRRPTFSPVTVHVGFLVDRMVIGQVFFQVLQYRHFTLVHAYNRTTTDGAVYRPVETRLCITLRASTDTVLYVIGIHFTSQQ